MIGEITVGALAAAAITEAAKTLAKEGTSAGVGLLAWLRDKLTSRGIEALHDLEKDPSSPDNQADARKQLVKLLEARPELRAELQSLVPSADITASSMNQLVQGEGAKGIQLVGKDNKASIS